MFENIIAQSAAVQITADIRSHRLAPSMLFYGPAASAKGSSAIELARILSCENETALWNCSCSSCVRHRSLLHPDLAILGPRNFASEISAAHAAFLREPSAAARSFFIRSLRKLLARFQPSVWEYESKPGKASPLLLIRSLEEDLDEFEQLAGVRADDAAVMEKISGSLIKNASKLEDDYIGDTVPISQIRRAAYWSRLSPAGRKKTLVIENADHMKDEARNSLLKLLEEPPESICIVLTSLRRESLLSTILSRLRPYRFMARSGEDEKEILRRVFRVSSLPQSTVGITSVSLVEIYLNSFMPQSGEKLLPLADFFVKSVEAAAVYRAGKSGVPVNVKETIATLLSGSDNFQGKSFLRFLSLVLDTVSHQPENSVSNSALIGRRTVWSKRIAEAQSACNVWNQKPELALESLFCRLADDFAVSGYTSAVRQPAGALTL